jgi:hypothetical protein
MSALANIVFWKKRRAVVALGSRSRSRSQSFGCLTMLVGWSQNRTANRSRSYMPLQTIPFSRGEVPVVRVAWAVQVTAGNGGRSDAP